MDKEVLIAIVVGTVAATTLMTIFSYSVSRLRNRQFTEPVLLNRFLCGFGVLKEYQLEKNLAGWVLHYAIGLMFLVCYYFVWSRTSFDPTWKTALVLGAISGLIGIIGWAILFKIQSVPANIRVSEYFTQLFVAHVIFALTATATFRLVT